MRLSELKEGQEGYVVKILGHGAFRKRLTEMGFVRGKLVKNVLSAPLKDPVKYSLLGYEVSLRRSEAQMVEIIEAEKAENPILSPIEERLQANDISDIPATGNCIMRSESGRCFTNRRYVSAPITAP